MNTQSTHIYAKRISTLILPLLLAACAGGGGVETPKTIPTAKLPTSPQFKIGGKIVDNQGREGTITELNENSEFPMTMSQTSAGSLKVYEVVRRYWREVSWDPSQSGWKTEQMWGANIFAYTTPEGKVYRLEALSNPQANTGFGITNTQNPTRHEMLPLADNGGKLISCCENGSNSFPPGYLSDSRFGAWMSPNGQVQFFNGGVIAEPGKMLGATDTAGAKGKMTFEVIGIRIKNGMAMTSSHDTAKKDNSLLTVNFNTGKLGGKIIGNRDFGGDIDFNNVSVNGNTFSGTAVSEGKTGQVNGNFFGKKGWGWYGKPAGSEIGGQVDFGNGNLNTVFGGSSIKHNADDTSQDLNHLNP